MTSTAFCFAFVVLAWHAAHAQQQDSTPVAVCPDDSACRDILQQEFFWPCEEQVSQCNWTLLDLTFQVQANSHIFNGTASLTLLTSTDHGAKYTSKCREMFSEHPACVLENVEEAVFSLDTTSIVFAAVVILFEVAALVEALVTMFKGYLFEDDDLATLKDELAPILRVFRKIPFLGAGADKGALHGILVRVIFLSAASTIGCSVGKLFWWNAKYLCETRQCTKLVHNSILMLVTWMFDALSAYISSGIEGTKAAAGDGERMCGARMNLRALISFKLYALLAVMAWVAYDYEEAATAFPGTGSLTLAFTALAAEALLAIFEVFNFARIYRKVEERKKSTQVEPRASESELVLVRVQRTSAVTILPCEAVECWDSGDLAAISRMKV